MTEDGSRRDDEILQAALECTPDARDSVLDAACGGDVERRARIVRLLDAFERAGGFLDHDTVDPWIGREVGAYEIVSWIGDGGAGRVYEARRARGDFEQRVAVKILRRSIDVHDDARRFRTECEALARLEHPHVARLIDGGMVDDAHPFLVMERIDGQELHAYCDAKRLDVTARLRLFVDICSAVDYAHRNLVIHRDLKPSNVLVTDEGHVKLLDFGIAKLVAPDDVPDEDRTRTEHVRLTPRYASPEQLSGAPIDTLSDVYSLGVILYELLAGTRPYRLEGSTSSEWARVVERTTITRPSRAFPSEAPDARGESERSLRRRLDGDLDNVVLRALERDPSRRYGSPRALADDVERHLAGQPVLARPATLGYRLMKMARRNPVGFGAGALALIALATAATVSSVALARVRAAQQDSERERRTAERTVDFLQNLIASVDPEASQSPESITVLQLLEGSAGRIDDELADEPAVAARLHRTLGRAYQGLQAWESAGTSYARSVELHREAFGARHAFTVQAASDVAYLQSRNGDFAGALATVDSILTALNDAPAALRLGPLAFRSDLLAQNGDFEGAVETGEAALEILRAHDDPERRLEVLNDVGLAFVRVDRPSDAIATFTEAVALSAELHGELHTRTGRMHQNLGYALRAAGRPEDAIPPLRRAIAIYEQVYEADNVHIGVTRSNLADVLASTGDFVGSIENHQAAIAIFREGLGPDHVNVGHATHNLGTAYMLQGDYDRAVERIDEALVIYRDVFGVDHPFVTSAMHNKARCLRRSGRLDESMEIGREVLRRREEVLDAEHPDIARSSEFMGRLMKDMGRPADALPWFERSLAIRREVYAEDNAMRIDAQRDLGACLASLGRDAEAVEHLRVACEAYATHRGAEDEKAVACAEELARVLERLESE